MSSEHLEKTEALLLVFLLFFNQLFDELLQLRLAGFRNQRLLKKDLVNKPVNVRSTQRKQIASQNKKQTAMAQDSLHLIQKWREISVDGLTIFSRTVIAWAIIEACKIVTEWDKQLTQA